VRRTASLLALAAMAGCGGGAAQDGGPSDPFTEVRRAVERPAAARATPRWDRVRVISGEGPATRSVSIARGAIQWRARWRCEGGGSLRASSKRDDVVRGRCPGRGVGTAAATTGAQRIVVRADGPWRVEIEQQVDTPLREPPLASMGSTASRVLATGRFYGIERRGAGTATLHRLKGGRLALRFAGFATSPNTDLFVWVVRATRPRTSRVAFRARHRTIAPLRSTLGDQNYVLPRGVRERDVRSIVIWCEPVRIAYAAAAMRAP